MEVCTFLLIRESWGEKRKRQEKKNPDRTNDAIQLLLLDSLTELDREILNTAAMKGIEGNKVINTRHWTSHEYRTPKEVLYNLI